MKTFVRIAALSMFSMLLAACGQDSEPKSLVDRLSVLAVRAEPPEGAPGTTVTVDALVGDPEGRAVSLEWFVCTPDPNVGTSSCADPARLTSIGTGPSVDLVLPVEAMNQDLFVATRATAGADTTDIAVKRVRVSDAVEANANPALVDFAIAGSFASNGKLMVPAGDTLALSATATQESPEAYVDEIGAPAIEEMKFSWFATAGTTEKEITYAAGTGVSESSWIAPGRADARATLWVVMRDGRGGVDWRTLAVETAE